MRVHQNSGYCVNYNSKEAMLDLQKSMMDGHPFQLISSYSHVLLYKTLLYIYQNYLHHCKWLMPLASQYQLLVLY